MYKKTFASSLMAVLLVVGFVQQRSVATAVGFNWTTTPLEEVTEDPAISADATDQTTSTAEAPKKKGNGFVRALSAPFRALGRLFGGGSKKNTDQQATRR